MTNRLKLKAESEADLLVLSAALQDAILRVGDIKYDQQARSVSLRLSRFDHEHADPGARVLTGLRLDGVLKLRSREINRADPDAMMVLMSMSFDPDDTPPGGDLTLTFSGGGEIQARLECIDAILVDVSDPRKTDKIPLHPLEAE